jgi:predicted Zn-dependent protease
MKRTFVAIVAVLVLAVPASAATYLPIQWRGSPPITITLVNVSVTNPYLVEGIAQAAASWGASSTFDLVVGSKGSKKIRLYEADYGTQYLMAWMDADSKSGNGYINEAAIHFNRSLMGDIATAGTLLRAIVCHEVGHALGLDHNENPDPEPSCMVNATSSEYPSAEDFANLVLRYGG